MVWFCKWEACWNLSISCLHNILWLAKPWDFSKNFVMHYCEIRKRCPSRFSASTKLVWLWLPILWTNHITSTILLKWLKSIKRCICFMFSKISLVFIDDGVCPGHVHEVWCILECLKDIAPSITRLGLESNQTWMWIAT